MRQPQLRIRTIMIAIAAFAVLMVPVRIALHNAAIVGVAFGVIALLGPSIGLSVFPFVLDKFAGPQSRVSSKLRPFADERNSSGEPKRT